MAAAPLTAGAHHRADHAGGPPGQEAIADAMSVEFDDLDATTTDANNFGLEEGVEGTLEGVFNITSFEIGDVEGVDRLLAVGNLAGTFTPDGGDPVPFDEDATVPVGTLNETDELSIAQQNGQERCPILFLEIGPVFLDLLGLVVEIPEPIILEVYALPGEGRLLGNLLCAIVGILDPETPDPVGTPLDRLIDNLNRLLERILG